jgi:ribose transport system permease protein
MTSSPQTKPDGGMLPTGSRPAQEPAAEGRGVGLRSVSRSQITAFALKYGMVWVLVLLAFFANSLYDGFFSSGNLNNLIAQIAPTAIVAVGMTFVIISGGFDLSVGALFAAGAVLYADLSNSMSLPAAFALTTLIGVAAGVFNGAVITGLNINPFIATLASASLFSGATYLYSDNAPVQSLKEGFTTLGADRWNGIWISSFVLTALLVVAGVVLASTAYGRSIYAVGGNLEAARLAGMRVKLIRTSAFAIAGGCAAIGGMIVASQTGVGQANIGPTVTLDAIAIVIIGGTSLMGGEGAMWRTFIGLLMYGTIRNVFNSLALDTSSQLLMQGGILLVAVALDALTRRSRA